jgi:hypothetical protein
LTRLAFVFLTLTYVVQIPKWIQNTLPPSGSSPLDGARVCGEPADTDSRVYAAPVAAPAGPVPPLQPPGDHPAVDCRHAGRVSDPGFNQVIGPGFSQVSGSGFSQVSGSGSVFGIRIRIQEGKNDPQTQCLRTEGFFCNLDVLYGGEDWDR